MKVGFSGTRKGMSPRQKAALKKWLLDIADGGDFRRDAEFHHGDCVGADEQAHDIAKALGWRIVVHPPSKNGLRAYCEGDLILIPQPYLTRNRHIVNETEMLIAAPEYDINNGGGTWYTIEVARSLQTKRVEVLKR